MNRQKIAGTVTSRLVHWLLILVKPYQVIITSMQRTTVSMSTAAASTALGQMVATDRQTQCTCVLYMCVYCIVWGQSSFLMTALLLWICACMCIRSKKVTPGHSAVWGHYEVTVSDPSEVSPWSDIWQKNVGCQTVWALQYKLKLSIIIRRIMWPVDMGGMEWGSSSGLIPRPGCLPLWRHKHSAVGSWLPLERGSPGLSLSGRHGQLWGDQWSLFSILPSESSSKVGTE